MISAINEVETAVQAMKHGAYHYITKNFDYDELRSLVRNACERQDLNRQVMTLSAQVAEQSDREFHLGPSKLVRDIVELVHKVAKLSATVLILGESGTGKELLARLLHKESGRGDAPFIAVNMEVEALSISELGNRISTGDFDAILAERTSGRSLVWTYLTFHSSKGFGYQAADKVLDRLRLVSSDGEVRAAVSDLQQVIHDDPPAIFFAWPTVARVVSSKFQVLDDSGRPVPEDSGRDVIGTLRQWKLTQAAK